jgi:hypothetical protein
MIIWDDPTVFKILTVFQEIDRNVLREVRPCRRFEVFRQRFG